MKIDDLSQNLPGRIGTIQIIAFVLLSLLGARLYYLQINRGDEFAKKAENQRVRKIAIPAPRGAIFDRNGKLLVDSRPTFSIVLSHEPIKTINPVDRLEDYMQGLALDRQFLLDRLNFIKKQPGFEAMVLKDNANTQDIAWVESHQLEFPELRVELQPQRHYPYNKVLAHVLGYVGEISPKQLESPDYQGFKPGDIIGKGGLEQSYDEQLRGVPGWRKVLVDSRGRVQDELEVVKPQAGQDLYSTIDIDLQLAAEQSLANSSTKRGAIIAMNPNNGEILAMASAPSFDPNSFVERKTTPEGRKEIQQYYLDKDHPLLNRAIQGLYHAGSTFKIPESIAGLQQGIITVKDSHVLCGGGITIGNKFTRCMGSHGAPPLDYAITKSCDGYYYHLALKMGIDNLIKMYEEFDFDKKSGIDLPNEKTPQTPKYWKPVVEKREGKWSDIRTVYASIGQDTVAVTPLSLIRAISVVGVQGRMYIPHLLKEFKEIGGIGEEGTDNFIPAKPTLLFDRPDPKIIAMTPEQNALVLKGMWGVVNNGGTAQSIKMANWELAGKTGTAQNSSLGSGGAKDHAWFMSFAPAYKPEIAVIGLIENSGFGAANAGPAVKAVHEAYLVKRQPTPEDAVQQRASR